MEFNEKQIDILLAAERLFATKGFDGTSVRDIANEANVNVAMINYYFGSKDKLLDTFFEWRVPDFMINVDELALIDNALDKIDAMVDRSIKSMNSHRKLYHIITIESSLKQRMLISEAFRKLKLHNLEVISSVINEGVKQGVFKAGYDPILIHSMMMGTFMNFQMNHCFLQDQLHIDNDEEYANYIETTLTEFIQKTIKALLTYEK
ncbi:MULTISPECIES: TetR/AcrR family transcriptional regulator [unclassified Sphingobacterium]|uniref:TetR/AcrR family transcriptional regulator n=1 Tax=unclassified Sphingobacterium TaxID=2609468 RepID=UPI0025E26A48|nr:MULTISPECIES: TetR family transcriptional regulator [unclassified Sphingobacterium]